MVIAPNISRLEYTRGRDGVKYFELTAEPVMREVLPGLFIKGWGYNGSIPGPCIQVCTGDNCRIRLYNRLTSDTSLEFLGLSLPFAETEGSTPRRVAPGGYIDYSFRVRSQPGTHIYRPGVNTLVQLNKGMCGNFIILSNDDNVCRDYSLMLQSFKCPSLRPGETPEGSFDIDPYADDRNLFCINARCYPHTESMKTCYGDSCRIRFSSGSSIEHPMYLNGHRYTVTAYDGCRLPQRVPRGIISMSCGQTCDIMVNTNNPGNWLCASSVPKQSSNNFSLNIGGMCCGFDYL